MSDIIKKNSWDFLKEFTDARIALGRAGTSLNTQEMLKFQLAHAQAKDAVYSELNIEKLKIELEIKFNLKIPLLNTLIENRTEYLLRPDLGKKLNLYSEQLLKNNSIEAPEIAFIIADGLSAQAIETNALKFLESIIPLIKESNYNFKIYIVSLARVAIGDHIGEIIKAKMTVVLIGERPGLSSPDSMGIYLTFKPKLGNLDDARNCISNIRPKGLDYKNAAKKLMILINNSFKLQLSGINLKDLEINSGGYFINESKNLNS